MKLLLFSDLHCDQTIAKRLVEQAKAVDVVIGAGDFCNMHRGLGECIDILKAIEKPTVVVPGNAETVEELTEACRRWPSAYVLHGNGVEIGGVAFYGLGGGVPVTPFGSWSYDFTEEQAAALLANCPQGAVLVSHSPPKGTVDDSSRGQSLGSTALRQTIEEKVPVLVVCGHIHDCAGQSEMIGETEVINAGTGGMVWEFGGG